jgi:hypothetical protein
MIMPSGYLHDAPAGSDEINPVAEEKEAIARLAHSYDGLLMHRFLRRTLEAVFDLEPSSALPFQNGRRSLARDLMRLMAEGIETQSGRSSDPAILKPGTGPAGVGRSAFRGTARRVSPDPAVERRLASDTAIAASGDDNET